VVRGGSCLALAAARGLCGVHCARAICLLVDSTVIVGGGLLVVLLVPLLFGALLSTLDRNPTPSFFDAFGGVGRHMERSRKCPSMCVASGHPCQHPPGIIARSPSSSKFVVP
jgi:hypothetical protein